MNINKNQTVFLLNSIIFRAGLSTIGMIYCYNLTCHQSHRLETQQQHGMVWTALQTMSILIGDN